MVCNTCGHSDDEHIQTKEARSPRIISMECGHEVQPEDLHKQLNGQMTTLTNISHEAATNNQYWYLRQTQKGKQQRGFQRISKPRRYWRGYCLILRLSFQTNLHLIK